MLESPFLKSCDPLSQTILFLWSGSSMLQFLRVLGSSAGWAAMLRLLLSPVSLLLTHLGRVSVLQPAIVETAAPGGRPSTQDTPVTVVWGLETVLRMSFLGNISCLNLGPFPCAWFMMVLTGRVPLSFWADFMSCRWAPWHCLQLLLGFSSFFLLLIFFLATCGRFNLASNFKQLWLPALWF